LDRVQHQITPEDFHDTDYRAIYTTFLRLASQGEVAVSSYIIDEVTSPKQQELLSKMAMGPVLSSQAEISKALDDCLLDIRQRQLKAQRQSIHKQLKTVGDGTAEQQQLLQEYNRLSKEQPMSFS
jgi:replicative DNA helicase